MENRYPYVNTPLPYAYDALEPFIDEKTMHLHHDRHLQTYIDNLNGLLRDCPALQCLPLEKLLTSPCHIPASLAVPVRNNAGGVYNHRFFFAGMAPPSGAMVRGRLYCEIDRQFGGLDRFKTLFKAQALEVFGSGYAWLVQEGGRLKITATPNQDTPLARGQYPLLTIDVWEHAYYLKHYNQRAAYIDDWFAVVDWNRAEQLWENRRRRA
ncbi:MAG: superoxide dismutase [Acutalibacteraceae bacterium]|nr:superoxide dismutase [Clostridiales bacterium]